MAFMILPERTEWLQHPVRAVMGLICRWGVAGVFLWAGVVKAWDPQAFLFDVRSFQLVPDPWAAILAMGLPWLEIVCALAILLGPARRGALVILSGCLGVFIAALAWSWHRGLNVTCGCFGHGTDALSYPRMLTVRAVFLAAALWSAWRARVVIPAQN
jgi:putative oxidoreductase